MYAIRSYYELDALEAQGAVLAIEQHPVEAVGAEHLDQLRRGNVITSYSIHYTKLYEPAQEKHQPDHDVGDAEQGALDVRQRPAQHE